MRTYFGEEKGILDEEGELVTTDPVTGEPVDRDQRAAATATPEQAAFLAGIIASPSAYDPVQNIQAAEARKELVLDRMLEQDMITQEQHDEAARGVPPDEDNDQRAPARLGGALLHDLGDPAGGGQVRRRPRVRRRDGDQDDARPRAPGRGRVRRLPDQRRRPVGFAGDDRERDRRGQGARRRRQLPREAVQPRHQRTPATRLRVQAVHPAHRSRAGQLRARQRLRIARRRSSPSPTRTA